MSCKCQTYNLKQTSRQTVSPLLDILMLTGHVDAEQDLAVKAEPALQAGQPSWQSKVGQNMVLGSVQAVQALVA